MELKIQNQNGTLGEKKCGNSLKSYLDFWKHFWFVLGLCLFALDLLKIDLIRKNFFFGSRQCRHQEGMMMVSHKLFTPVLHNASQWGTCYHLLKLTDLLSHHSVITILQTGFYTAVWGPWHHFKVCLGCIFLCLVYDLSEQIVLWCNSFRSWPHWLVKAIR